MYLGGLFTHAGGRPQSSLACVGVSSTPTDVPGRTAPGLDFAGSPNPFAERAQLVFTLPEAERVSVRVLDAAGRAVATPLHDTWLLAGPHAIGLPAAGLAPGVYFARLDAGGRSRTVKLVRRE